MKKKIKELVKALEKKASAFGGIEALQHYLTITAEVDPDKLEKLYERHVPQANFK